jgi:hypothetical protein
LARIAARIRAAFTSHRAHYHARYDGQAARIAQAFKRKAPKVVDSTCPEHKCGEGGWSGRYDPATHTVHRAMEKRMSPARRKALKGHEVAHAMVCDRKSKTCTYKGQHDRRFYKTLAKVHRKLGTNPKAAVEVEQMSGYKPPRGFARGVRKGAR